MQYALDNNIIVISVVWFESNRSESGGFDLLAGSSMHLNVRVRGICVEDIASCPPPDVCLLYGFGCSKHITKYCRNERKISFSIARYEPEPQVSRIFLCKCKSGRGLDLII